MESATANERRPTTHDRSDATVDALVPPAPKQRRRFGLRGCFVNSPNGPGRRSLSATIVFMQPALVATTEVLNAAAPAGEEAKRVHRQAAKDLPCHPGIHDQEARLAGVRFDAIAGCGG